MKANGATAKAAVRRPVRRRRTLGQYIVADPRICHGAPTFRGTRIFVTDVLEQVADGMEWNRIVKEWRGSVTKAAIAEAVSLSRRAFVDHIDEYSVEPPPL